MLLNQSTEGRIMNATSSTFSLFQQLERGSGRPLLVVNYSKICKNPMLTINQWIQRKVQPWRQKLNRNTNKVLTGWLTTFIYFESQLERLRTEMGVQQSTIHTQMPSSIITFYREKVLRKNPHQVNVIQKVKEMVHEDLGLILRDLSLERCRQRRLSLLSPSNQVLSDYMASLPMLPRSEPLVKHGWNTCL